VVQKKICYVDQVGDIKRSFALLGHVVIVAERRVLEKCLDSQSGGERNVARPTAKGQSAPSSVTDKMFFYFFPLNLPSLTCFVLRRFHITRAHVTRYARE
jgi:hypothetical protein